MQIVLCLRFTGRTQTHKIYSVYSIKLFEAFLKLLLLSIFDIFNIINLSIHEEFFSLFFIIIHDGVRTPVSTGLIHISST